MTELQETNDEIPMDNTLKNPSDEVVEKMTDDNEQQPVEMNHEEGNDSYQNDQDNNKILSEPSNDQNEVFVEETNDEEEMIIGQDEGQDNDVVEEEPIDNTEAAQEAVEINNDEGELHEEESNQQSERQPQADEEQEQHQEDQIEHIETENSLQNNMIQSSAESLTPKIHLRSYDSEQPLEVIEALRDAIKSQVDIPHEDEDVVPNYLTENLDTPPTEGIDQVEENDSQPIDGERSVEMSKKIFENGAKDVDVEEPNNYDNDFEEPDDVVERSILDPEPPTKKKVVLKTPSANSKKESKVKQAPALNKPKQTLKKQSVLPILKKPKIVPQKVQAVEKKEVTEDKKRPEKTSRGLPPVQKSPKQLVKTSSTIQHEKVADKDEIRQEVSSAEIERVAMNYTNVLSSLRHEIAILKGNVAESNDILKSARAHEAHLENEILKLKSGSHIKVDQGTRVLLDRQKKSYQVLVGKLRREVRRLKFQKNSVSDPLIEVQYFPYLPRTPYGTSAERNPTGSIGSLPTKSSDYFVLNPPPPTGSHPESGNRWWWGQGPSLSKHLPTYGRPRTAPSSNAPFPEKTSGPISEFYTTGHPPIPEKIKQRSTPNYHGLKVGDRLCVDIQGESCFGMLKYIGFFDAYPDSGLWCGLKMDSPIGKHNGVANGKRYFKCEDNHGVFVKIGKVLDVQKAPSRKAFAVSR